MQERIKYATLVHEPFPYVHIDNVFPNKFYQCLLSKLPTEEVFFEQVRALDRCNRPSL